MRRALVALALAFMAGCAGNDDSQGTDTTTATATATATATTTVTTSAAGSATLTADTTRGEAPLDVTFTIEADGDAEAWSLDFGDGGPPSTGGDVPAEASHRYEAGEFTATVTVTFAGGATAKDAVEITALAATGGEPPQTHFEFGESLGCWKDIAGTCVSIEAGPDEPPVDGFWVPLDERYWSLELTSAVDHGTGLCTEGQWPTCDSDCSFYDESLAEIGEANNGENACVGTVPEGSAWLFLYPYGSPGVGMTLDFLL